MKICKLCLRQTAVSLPLRGYRDMIRSLTTVEVGVTSTACLKCVLNLKLAYNIQQEMTKCLEGLRKAIKVESDVVGIEEAIASAAAEAPNVCEAKCFICGKTNIAGSTMNDHVKSHFECKPVTCKPCSKPFKTFDSYKKHLEKQHEWYEVYECEKCEMCFKYTPLYDVHIKLAHKRKTNTAKTVINRKTTTVSPAKSSKDTQIQVELPVLEDPDDDRTKCELCDEDFGTVEKYKRHASLKKRCGVCRLSFCLSKIMEHRMKHKQEAKTRKAICEICGVTLSNRKTLQTHLRFRHRPAAYKCKECGIVYKQKTSLKVHIRKEHVGVATYVCEICGKGFFRKSNIRHHIDVKHKKLQPNVCKFCNKTFSTRKAMQRHERQHTNETPYKCDECGAAFKHNVSLKGHKKTKHGIEEEKNCPCTVCGKKFGSKYALETHVYRAH